MFIYGFYILSVSVQELKKNCNTDKSNGLIYNEIHVHVSNKWKFVAGLGIQTRDPCITRRCSTTELHVSRPINIHGSRPNYHIPPLTKFLPFKKLTTNTYMFILSGLDWLKKCLIKDGHSTTQTLFLIYIHVPVL